MNLSYKDSLERFEVSLLINQKSSTIWLLLSLLDLNQVRAAGTSLKSVQLIGVEVPCKQSFDVLGLGRPLCRGYRLNLKTRLDWFWWLFDNWLWLLDFLWFRSLEDLLSLFVFWRSLFNNLSGCIRLLYEGLLLGVSRLLVHSHLFFDLGRTDLVEHLVIHDVLLVRSPLLSYDGLSLQSGVDFEVSPWNLVDGALLLSKAHLDLPIDAASNHIDHGVLDVWHLIAVIVLLVDVDEDLVAIHLVWTRHGDGIDPRNANLTVDLKLARVYSVSNCDALTSNFSEIVDVLLGDHDDPRLVDAVLVYLDDLATQVHLLRL